MLGILIFLNVIQLLYFNVFTHSLPYGIYIKVNANPSVGDYAATCLTPEIAHYGMERGYLERGICGTGTVRVLKIIEGIPGSHFWVKDGFLRINRHSYKIMVKDSLGRPLPMFYNRKEGTLSKGQYMLLSDFVDNSWDSRYWGPVSIQFLLKPFWMFEDIKK